MFDLGNDCPNCGERISSLKILGRVEQDIRGWVNIDEEVEILNSITSPNLIRAEEYQCPDCDYMFHFQNPEEANEWLNSGQERIPNFRVADDNYTSVQIDLLDSLNIEEVDHLDEALNHATSSFERILELVDSQKLTCRICNDIYNKLTWQEKIYQNDNYGRRD